MSSSMVIASREYCGLRSKKPNSGFIQIRASNEGQKPIFFAVPLPLTHTGGGYTILQ